MQRPLNFPEAQPLRLFDIIFHTSAARRCVATVLKVTVALLVDDVDRHRRLLSKWSLRQNSHGMRTTSSLRLMLKNLLEKRLTSDKNTMGERSEIPVRPLLRTESGSANAFFATCTKLRTTNNIFWAGWN